MPAIPLKYYENQFCSRLCGEFLLLQAPRKIFDFANGGGDCAITPCKRAMVEPTLQECAGSLGLLLTNVINNSNMRDVGNFRVSLHQGFLWLPDGSP